MSSSERELRTGADADATGVVGLEGGARIVDVDVFPSSLRRVLTSSVRDRFISVIGRPFSDILLMVDTELFTLAMLLTLLVLLILTVLLLRISLADTGITTPSAFRLSLENLGGAAVESQFSSGSRDVDGL